MNCYRCGTAMQERNAAMSGEYAGEQFEVMTPAMVCPNCDYKSLHANQIDEYTTKLSDLYREKHSLLKSKDIRQIRARLGMSQEDFARYLNVGVASVKRWELGKVQDQSSDELIRVKCILKRAEQNLADVLLRNGDEGDQYSGGRSFSFIKLANVILFFLSESKKIRRELGPLHINKLCWYADAENYRRHRVSITGSRYARLPLGPVLDDYRFIFGELCRRRFVRARGTQVLESLQAFASETLSAEEIASLEHTWSRFSNRLSRIVRDSHEEKAWKETAHADLISFKWVK